MRIMVLNDSETFSALSGCAIYEVPDSFDTEDIESAVADRELTPLKVFGDNDLGDYRAPGMAAFDELHKTRENNE